MATIRPDRVLFPASMAGLGILSLLSGDFAMNWQPVPAGIPGREALAYASGAMLLLGGAGTFFRRTAVAGAMLLALNLMVWILALQIPRVTAGGTHEYTWLGLGETLVLFGGGWILFASLLEPQTENVRRSLLAAKILFAVALLPIGLSHFIYGDVTAGMVPAWLPFRLQLGYLTGAAHIAAGLAILVGVLPRHAATLEAAMMSLFTLLIWVPAVAASPAARFPWTAMLASAAIAGAAWIVAAWLGHTERQG